MSFEHEFFRHSHQSPEATFTIDERGRRLETVEVSRKVGEGATSKFATCIIAEELQVLSMIFEFGVFSETSSHLCSDDEEFHRQRPVEAGSCYTFAKPVAGSGFDRIRTRAVLVSDEWFVNGRMTLNSHLEYTGILILSSTTDPKLGHRGDTCFFVDKWTECFDLTWHILTNGGALGSPELSRPNCRMPDANWPGIVIAELKFPDCQQTHDEKLIAISWWEIALRSVTLAVGWPKHATSDKLITTEATIRRLSAYSLVELDVAYVLVRLAVWLTEQGSSYSKVFVANFYVAEMCRRTTGYCQQFFGCSGYSKNTSVESFCRQAPMAHRRRDFRNPLMDDRLMPHATSRD